MSAIETKMSEEQAVNLVRNALLVAGMEMGGKDGDHWPVIKSTIHSLAKDYENVKIEHNVFAEVKKFYQDLFRELDALRKGSTEAFKIDLDMALDELHALYDACFSDVAAKNFYVDSEDMPEYIRRTEVILNTLEEDDV